MRLFILLALLSTSSFATEYCEKFSFTSGKLDCLKLATENFVDDKAGMFCAEKITFDSDKLNCIKLSVNKKYRRSTIRVCESMTFNSDKLKCIETSGKPFSEGNVLREIFWMAEDAIMAIEEQNLGEAHGIVTDLKDLVREQLDGELER